MNSLVAEIISGMNKHEYEAFLGAAMVAEHVGMTNVQPVPPYDELLKANPPTSEDIVRLKQALLDYVQSDTAMLSNAYFALGKFYDRSMIPLFREKLGKELQSVLEHSRALSSLIIALDNCGEKPITTGVQDPFEVDRSIQHAREYLKRYGQTYPT